MSMSHMQLNELPLKGANEVHRALVCADGKVCFYEAEIASSSGMKSRDSDKNPKGTEKEDEKVSHRAAG